MLNISFILFTKGFRNCIMSKKIIIAAAAAITLSACGGAAYSLLRPVDVYKPNAEPVKIPQMKLSEYLTNGWYKEPVRTMYNTSGEEICIEDSLTDEYKNQGWFTEHPIEIYAPDGRTMYINESELEAYENQGWYSEAVTMMYADDGRTLYVKNSEIDDYLNVNWYLQRPDTEGMENLKSDISKYISSRSGQWGVFVQNLGNNEYLSINEKEYSGASLIKLFTMAATYNEIECGSFEETDTVDELLNQMITESSNTACNALTKRLGGGSTINGFSVENKMTKSIGCQNTNHGSELIDESGQHAVYVSNNRTSPRDCGRVLKEIYNGTLVSKEASDKMLDLLKHQTRTWKIPAALPEGTVTANKTGETNTVQADAAIVYSPNTDFILCAIGNGDVDSGIDTISHIAKMVYNYFNP